MYPENGDRVPNTGVYHMAVEAGGCRAVESDRQTTCTTSGGVGAFHAGQSVAWFCLCGVGEDATAIAGVVCVRRGAVGFVVFPAFQQHHGCGCARRAWGGAAMSTPAAIDACIRNALVSQHLAVTPSFWVSGFCKPPLLNAGAVVRRGSRLLPARAAAAFVVLRAVCCVTV